MFDFLKGNNEAPPDIGKEEEYDALNSANQNPEPSPDIPEDIPPPIKKTQSSYPKFDGSNSAPVDERIKLEVEKINARLEAVNQWMGGYSERFSNLSERIGEIRTMAMSNEKLISKCSLDASRAMDLVNGVKPERLRLEYQRLDLKVSSFLEKLEAKKQYEQAIMNELKDLRQKAGIFIGTDGLLRLNEEVKRDLIEIQKLGARVRMDADKAEQIFIELKSGFAEVEKAEELTLTLHQNYSGLQKEVEKLKLDFSSIIKDSEFESFKKNIQSRVTVVEKLAIQMDQVKEENSRLGKIIETILGVSKRNKEDISNIAVTIGDNKIKSVSDYENQVDSLLGIIDQLAQQLAGLRKQMGMKPEKINVRRENKKITHNSSKTIKEEIPRTIAKSKPLVKKSEKKIKKSKVKKQIKKTKKKIAKKVADKKQKKKVKKTVEKKIVAKKNSVKKDFKKLIKETTAPKKRVQGITKRSVKPEFISDSDEEPEIKEEAKKEEVQEEKEKAEVVNVNPADDSEKKGFFGKLFGGVKKDSEPIKY